MPARDDILSRLRSLQSQESVEYTYNVPNLHFEKPVEDFKVRLTAIGGLVYEIESVIDINPFIKGAFPTATEIFSSFPEIQGNRFLQDVRPHSMHDLEVTVLSGEFGVAENGAIWLTQQNMLDRALPFISENLILVIHRHTIVNTLQEAYVLIDKSKYRYGVFIAGPSKTADIEQSLVLGAHGPKTLSVFMI